MSTPEQTEEPADDLAKPLGRKPRKKKRFAIPGVLVARGIAGVLGLCVAVLAGWILFVDDPAGGEPLAIVSADTRTSPQPAKPGSSSNSKPDAVAPPSALADTDTPPSPNAQAGANATANPAAKTVTIIDGSTGKRQEVTVGGPGSTSGAKQPQPASGKPETRSEPAPPVEQRMLEPSRHGVIPKVAPDGARPAETYSRPVKPQAGKQEQPRIAIVIEGLGIGANGTSEVLAKLPGPVTFAFAPYGTDLERWVNRARSEGHEVLLQVGMEPFDYPDNDPGPQTLLTSISPEQNIDRLHWFLSRFQGYVGITSLMGARFTATDQAMLPILRDVGKRGLIYFDTGASPRSVAAQAAGANNVAFAKADAAIDAVPAGAEIDNALARLEATARNRGFAVGSASALPITIDRIAQWAKNADARGIELVPISAVATRAKSAS